MALKLRKLSFAPGAEVCGVDVSRPMSESTFGEICQAFLANGIHLSGTRKLANDTTGIARAEEQKRSNPPVAQPVVRVHPETGRKFRRQQSIGPFIVDFYCAADRLVVELDGAAHDSERSATRDDERERFLRSLGLTGVWLESCHVLEDAEAVLAYISHHFRGS